MLEEGGLRPPRVREIAEDLGQPPQVIERFLFRAARLGIVHAVAKNRFYPPATMREMGRIADSLADQLVVTNDNPRSESPEMIVEDILVGITGSPCHVELDRGAAIRHAVLNARSGDTVLVAGKGHENYQLVGKNKLDFSDVSCAAEVLREREAAHA